MIVLISDLALSSSLQCKFLYINNLFTYRKVMEMRKWLKAWMCLYSRPSHYVRSYTMGSYTVKGAAACVFYVDHETMQ